MSGQLMDTSPGGETSQYESIQTVTKSPSRSPGQLGSSQEGTAPASSALFPIGSGSGSAASTYTNPSAGAKTAEKIRYGQAISEEGAGGYTAGGLGSNSAVSEDAGGPRAQEGESDNGAAKQRREQGYGGSRDMRRDVGA